ncbi:MAG: glycosyltransferase family 2 protein, partial [Nitrosopumilus sp.]|nr:glycosyltransferase family 2 protein [Nitrosopumilus sp.]
ESTNNFMDNQPIRPQLKTDAIGRKQIQHTKLINPQLIKDAVKSARTPTKIQQSQILPPQLLQEPEKDGKTSRQLFDSQPIKPRLVQESSQKILDSPSQKAEVAISSIVSGQKMQLCGRIHIPKKGWLLRITAILVFSGLLITMLYTGIRTLDYLVIAISIVLLDVIVTLAVGWFFYKNPAQGIAGNALVSVIIPVYNQVNMIEIVIHAIANSTYKNIEMMAVNDGSTDGSGEILDRLDKKYSNLRVFHQKNKGKTRANYLGASNAKGDFLLFIDSDSVVDKHAITEMMRAFNKDSKLGAIVGHIKPWNIKTSYLARLQDAWYDYEFNISKTTQSVLGGVMVCCGCFGGYRREAIEKYLPLMNGIKTVGKNYDYKKYYKKNIWGSKFLSKIPLKILEWASQFDDAEDAIMTAHAMVDWRTKYVSSAIIFSEVPDTFKGLLKQQIRWRKGAIRAMVFMMTFLYRKNILLAFNNFGTAASFILTPIILYTALYHAPFVLGAYWITAFFIAGFLAVGVVHGIDYKLRDPTSVNWKLRPIMAIIVAFVYPFLTAPALWTFRKSSWLTR